MSLIKYILPILILLSTFLLAQNEKKTIEAIRISNPPVIDGDINDSCWNNVPIATNFIQFEPYNDGRAGSQKTEVKITYNNNALYVAAMMYDTAPDSILAEFSERDNGDGNTDIFAFTINPFNDGINAVSFWLTAAGVQVDFKTTEEDMDEKWNAVWESNVKMLDKGWSAEIKIPYSALRFPKVKEQIWGVNFWRGIRRYREWSTWQYIDKKKGIITPQVGIITGIRDIEPPLRLSITPYVSSYAENYSEDKSFGYTFNGGMDLKYGINESFTLDVTLIPDFGQVQSDDKILNLTPFETYYNEKRSFFTEGTELFEKCEIFYSRRIGNEPAGYENVYDIVKDSEEIIENPEETKLINATKISGRTNKGLGIGLFNAMTSNTYASIEDTLGNTRKIRTQPFTNYSMIVFDQSLKNNSYISLVNTNVTRAKDNYSANVSGLEFGLLNKDNSYDIYGNGIISQKYIADSTDIGYNYEIGFEKNSGNFTFDIYRAVISNTYDPNDMGYLENNNEVENELELSYNIFDPFWIILRSDNSLSTSHISLYEPSKFSYFNIYLNSITVFKNHTTLFLNLFSMPTEGNDFFESRTGNVFKMPINTFFSIFISPDYRKKFVIDAGCSYGYSKSFHIRKAISDYDFTISPRLRLSNKMNLIYKFNYDKVALAYGYVTFNDSMNAVVFGERQVKTITNTISSNYIFNNKSSLSFRLRHYWSTAKYFDFFTLNSEGYLDNTNYTANHDINFNAFTIDMSYKWQFMPGSEISVVWKNNIYKFGDEIIYDYRKNLNNILNSPQINSISVKILYYLDYWYLKK